MCVCRPNVRTPFCGRLGCEWPKKKAKYYVECTEKFMQIRSEGQVVAVVTVEDPSSLESIRRAEKDAVALAVYLETEDEVRASGRSHSSSSRTESGGTPCAELGGRPSDPPNDEGERDKGTEPRP